jgi:hypothetical protein
MTFVPDKVSRVPEFPFDNLVVFIYYVVQKDNVNT